MSDDNDNVTELNKNKGGKQPSLIEQVNNDLKKAATESVKAKLKELLATKAGHEKSIRQIDEQISDLIGKFEKGIL